MRIQGLGIDLISLSRSRDFLKEHCRGQINRLLSPAEKRTFRTRKLTARLFSRLWVAKEAFFKAHGAAWLGPEGFASIEVKFLPRQRFRVKSLHLNVCPQEATGIYFNHPRWTGAHIIFWGEDLCTGFC